MNALPPLFSNPPRLWVIGAGGLGTAILRGLAPLAESALVLDLPGTMVPEGVRLLPVDLQDPSALARTLESAWEESVPTTVLYTARWRPDPQGPPAAAQQLAGELHVNLGAACQVGQFLLDRLRNRTTPAPLNMLLISSIAARRAGPESAGYHASKAGLEGFCRWLAVQGGPHALRVNALAPGFIVQDRHRARYDREDNQAYRTAAEAAHPLGGVGSDQDVVLASLFLVSDWSRFLTGQVIVLDGGLTVQDPWHVLWAHRPA